MKVSKKLLLVMVLAFVLVGGTAAYAVMHTTFTDVEGTTHEDGIFWAIENGISIGYDEGDGTRTFRPGNPVTRGQMATFLHRFNNEIVADMGGGDGATGCQSCHNAEGTVNAKVAVWEISGHGEGEAWEYAGFRAGCSGCHNGAGFSGSLEAGTPAGDYTATDEEVTDSTPVDCYTCHEIHESYTTADWGLATTAAVTLYPYDEDASTFDGGEGNLCANCHEVRHTFDEYVNEDGTVDVTSTHWGPHHGPQAQMMLGEEGAGVNAEGDPVVVDDGPMFHYTGVSDTCVTCHLGENDNHKFEPSVDACTTCHVGATSLDIGGVQTEVDGLLYELGVLLEAEGVLDVDPAIGSEEMVASDYSWDIADAAVATQTTEVGVGLWNFLYVYEDMGLGVHNPDHAVSLLEDSITALEAVPAE